jgi:murein DD-endopeptidase MepM/ murein hydrolase activator NlpD
MKGRFFRWDRWIVAASLAAFFSACAPGAGGPATTDYQGGLNLARSGAMPEEGTVAATSTPSRTLASTDSPPSITPTPSETPTLAITPTVTDTPAPTQKTFVYFFPVQPPGVADFAEGGHPYPATDIFVPVGTSFVAVTGGVVDFVSYKDLWDPATNNEAVAGGLCVAIIGDDGIRYYGSHLSAIARGIAPGVRVTAGQLLGLSGKTGNAVNTTPHVHFGISRPSFPADWAARRGQLDPFPYLTAWRRGENITPQFPTPTLIPDPSPN